MSKELVIYQTTDVHGYILTTNFLEYKPWGFAKVVEYIENQKDENKLLIDSGDFIQGSPLTYYVSKNKYSSHPIIELLNIANYNIFTIGNHEFNFSKSYLEDALSSFKGDVLNANIKGLDIDSKPYKIYDYEGVKICILGLTTKYIPNWEEPENIKGLEFLDPIEVYRLYEKEMKEQSDFIIVNYHGGFEKDLENHTEPTEELTGENQGSELLNTFDSIDILLTGHQHRGFIKETKNT